MVDVDVSDVIRIHAGSVVVTVAVSDVVESVRVQAETERLWAVRGDLAMLLQRALLRMSQYEMDVDTEPPRDHRQFMEKARGYLERHDLLRSPLRAGEEVGQGGVDGD